ncbi:Uncharacterised protein [Mycobacterium tuberculosis]|nr:Uncharacterised protein [Mycobacterium tuberculosis]
MLQRRETREQRSPNRRTNRLVARNLSIRRLQFNLSRIQDSPQRKCNRLHLDKAARLLQADRKAKAADNPADRRATADTGKVRIVKAAKAEVALKVIAVVRGDPAKAKAREAALTAAAKVHRAAAKAAEVRDSVRKVSRAEASRAKDRMPAKADSTSAAAATGPPVLERPGRQAVRFKSMGTIM